MSVYSFATDDAFVASFLKDDNDETGPKQQPLEVTNSSLQERVVKSPCTNQERVVFYDSSGNRISRSLDCINKTAFEFVVFPCQHAIFSISNPEAALFTMKTNDSDLEKPFYYVVPCLPSNILMDSKQNIAIAYRTFKQNNEMQTSSDKHFYSENVNTLPLEQYFSSLQLMLKNMPLPWIKPYTSSIREWQKGQICNLQMHIGAWSRSQGLKEAFKKHFFDVADLLEFYYVDPNWMWNSRFGSYVYWNYFYPLFRLRFMDHNSKCVNDLIYSHSHRQIQIEKHLGTCSLCLKTNMSLIACVFFSRSDPLIVDIACLSMLDVLFFISEKLHTFRTQDFDVNCQFYLYDVLSAAREQLRKICVH